VQVEQAAGALVWKLELVDPASDGERPFRQAIEPHVTAAKANTVAGANGSYSQTDSPLAWLNPLSLRKVINHIQDDYLANHIEQAQERLADYAELLAQLKASPAWEALDPTDRQEFDQMQSEIQLLLQRLEAGLDYFGKTVSELKNWQMSDAVHAEEIDALVAAGVPFEVVPGVTAALAAAAAAHMPLTRRAVSSSVTFVSAVGADDASTIDDVARLLDAGSTVAVYMGLRALPEIVGQLMASGVSGELPIAVICSASLPEENLTSGTLSDIEERLAANQADSGQPGAKPGLIVLGEVAAYAV
jgi:siroheme synthase